MYGWIWRHLPGSTPVRALISAALALAAVFLLFQYVFPWAEPLLPFNDVTVGGGGTPSAPASSPSAASPSPGSPSGGGLNGAGAPDSRIARLSGVAGIPGPSRPSSIPRPSSIASPAASPTAIPAVTTGALPA